MADELKTDGTQLNEVQLADLANVLHDTVESVNTLSKGVSQLISVLNEHTKSNVKLAQSNTHEALNANISKLATQIERSINKTGRQYSEHIGVSGSGQTRANTEKTIYDNLDPKRNEDLQVNIAKKMAGVGDATSKLKKDLGDFSEELTKRTRDLRGFMANPGASLRNKTYEIFSKTGASLGMKVGGPLGFLVGAGVGVVGSAIGRIIEGFFAQVAKGTKDYFSWNAIGGNITNAIGTEMRFGNFLNEGSNKLGMLDYAEYRYRMRRMGERDDARIAQNIQQLADVGIAGGNNRADAVSAALSRQAIKSVFGIDVSSQFMGSMYRSTGATRPSALYENDEFNLNKMFQRLAITVEKTANSFGGQTGINELFTVVQSVSQHFRGLDNNMDMFVSGLGVYSKLIAENVMTAKQAEDLLSTTQRISTSKQFEMLAWAGVSGNNFFEEREKFIRRGIKAEGSIENAQLFARSILGYLKNIGGSDAQRSYFLREQLSNMGYSDLATGTEDPKKLLERVAAGNRESVSELQTSMKSNKALLQKQAEGLDAIRKPVEHIRDFLFGELSLTKVARRLQSGAEAVAVYMAGLTPEQFEQLKSIPAPEGMTDRERLNSIVENTRALQENTKVKQQERDAYEKRIRDISGTMGAMDS